MAAMRCSKCNLNYPYDKKKCPICEGKLWRLEGEFHDKDWELYVKANRRIMAGEPIPNVEAPVVEWDGRKFVANKFLKDAGYLWLESGSIVKINGRYFEVLSAMFTNELASWWIEVMEFESEKADIDRLPVLTEAEYRELEKRRGLR